MTTTEGKAPAEEVSHPGAPDEAGQSHVVTAYILVQSTLILGLGWKWTYFKLSDLVYHNIELHHEFFPDFFRSPDVIRWAYLGALATITIGVLGVFVWVRRICAAATVGCLAILCLHQGSYNDATFTTSLWVAVWTFWFTTRIGDPPREQLDRGAFLARVIGSMILLGGAVGKWTPEYWSGEVFYDIYFRERDFWTFNYLREHYDVETLRVMAKWYSRKVVVLETIGGFGMWLLPPKWAALAGVVTFTSIALLSNFLLFSVLWCLIGLSAVGFLTMKKIRSDESDRSV